MKAVKLPYEMLTGFSSESDDNWKLICEEEDFWIMYSEESHFLLIGEGALEIHNTMTTKTLMVIDLQLSIAPKSKKPRKVVKRSSLPNLDLEDNE